MITLTVTDREAETLIALCEQEADQWEEERITRPKLAKTRAKYLRDIAKKIEEAKA